MWKSGKQKRAKFKRLLWARSRSVAASGGHRSPVRSGHRTGVEKLVAQTGPDRTGVRKWQTRPDRTGPVRSDLDRFRTGFHTRAETEENEPKEEKGSSRKRRICLICRPTHSRRVQTQQRMDKC